MDTTGKVERVRINGATCASCEAKIRDAVLRLPGALDVSFSPDRREMELRSERSLPLDAVRRAVQSAGPYTVPSDGAESNNSTNASDDAAPRESLRPLFVIVGYIALATLVIALAADNWDPASLMRHFMAGFFLAFSLFKMLDLRGFAAAYQTYDLLAARSRAWAYAYPFVELLLGLAYLANLWEGVTNVATLVLMLFGAAGVGLALRSGKRLRCACLGTALNLPMTTVTLIEDLAMAAMAGVMLIVA
ncbi:MAG: cation transporter [Phycisphaerales bacterium]|nr:cation transporter [Phycisphaerales bacterium]